MLCIYNKQRNRQNKAIPIEFHNLPYSVVSWENKRMYVRVNRTSHSDADQGPINE